MTPTVRLSKLRKSLGGLRFYVGAATNDVFDLIDEHEDMSYGICESCGSTEDVTQTKRGWIKTLCKKCMEAKGIDNT